MEAPIQDQVLTQHLSKEYEWGFEVQLEEELAPKGLNESIIEFIWAKKKEPPFMLDFKSALTGHGKR